MPSLAELEQWMEEQLPPNLHDLPMKVSMTIQSYSSHLYSQLYDLTPSYSQIESSIESSLHSIPFVGAHCTPTPPPPPTPVSLIESLMLRGDAVTGSRTRTSIVAGISVVGITYAVLSRSALVPTRLRRRGIRSPKIVNGSRQEAIDTPLGQSICHLLSAQGFIVLASVSDEDSMQVFDSLIPPSSRGYIKAVILNPAAPKADAIDYFVQSVASAKELRWPLTSAGDPYSRPGTEVQFTALINALSYRSVTDKSSGSSLHIDQLSQDLTLRVSTPLATIKALLPHLSSGNSTFVVSLIAPQNQVTSQALIAGMKKLEEEMAVKGTRSRILFTTLEAQSSSLQSRLLSTLPSRIGGGAPSIQQETKTPSSSLASSRVTDTKGQTVDKTATRPKAAHMSASSSDVRLQRHIEFKPLLQAVSGTVLMPLSTTSLLSKYTVQLPATISQKSDHQGLQRSILLRAIQHSSLPFAVLQGALRWITLYPSCLLSSWNRSSACYSGSRNAANSRPAYGPGPGPASNTHSRSCIRPSSDTSRQTTKRPPSANSAASSEAAKSGPPSSATASGPPSNNGMSSSGVLSSVPSSAFGDQSEEEHFDYEDGDQSPVQGSGPWASPVASDTDGDTALGARDLDTEATPSGSRANIEEVQYGFPSQASMQSSGDGSWMGPDSRGSPNPSEPAVRPPSAVNSAVPGTPLGQSWVNVNDST